MEKKILVACEVNQHTANLLREMGYEAYSDDIQSCRGGHPEWHIKGDVLPLLDGNCTFTTEDGVEHTIIGKWDMIIAHPVCTYLSNAGIRWFNEERYGDKARERIKNREEAAKFFMEFINADCDHIAVENPVGYMNTHYRKPDCTVHPWMFGDEVQKRTCFWLKGLEPLVPEVTEKPQMEYYEWVSVDGRHKTEPKWFRDALKAKDDTERRNIRSVTFPGLARAMCEQWTPQI